MSPEYKAIHQQADKLFYKFRDIVDDKHDPLAGSVEHEIKEIVEDIEVNKAPRAIEDRIRRVQQMMDKVRHGQSQMMTPVDADLLFNEYERMREQVRRLPNY